MYSDDQLIRKVKKRGDRKAADELIGRYYREIYAFVFRQVRDPETAMDLNQEIFIAVLRGLPSYDAGKAVFRTWLYTIAANKVTDYFRSKYHRQRILETDISEMEDIADSGLTEEKVIDRICETEFVMDAMAVLVEYGDEWVRIFQMKLFGERTFREIADMLALSENTVKTRYYTMLKCLRKEMEGWNTRTTNGSDRRSK